MWWKELIGIIASVFIIIGFMFKGEKLIRIINCIGAFIFVIYGVLIHSLSVSLLNSVSIIVNIIQLKKMGKHN